MDPGNRDTEKLVGVRGYRVRNPAKAEERRRAILLGAARAFVRHGYEATNLEDIAAESGVTKGHIYHYFLSKEHLFTEIVATSVEDSVREMEHIVAAGTTPEETLRNALEMHIAVVFQPLERQANLLGYPADLSPENHERLRQLERRYEGLFQGILEDGIARGTFVARDPRLMTFTLLRAAGGVAAWYRPGGAWTPEFIIHEVADQLLRSVLAPHAERPEGRPRQAVPAPENASPVAPTKARRRRVPAGTG